MHKWRRPGEVWGMEGTIFEWQKDCYVWLPINCDDTEKQGRIDSAKEVREMKSSGRVNVIKIHPTTS